MRPSPNDFDEERVNLVGYPMSKAQVRTAGASGGLRLATGNRSNGLSYIIDP